MGLPLFLLRGVYFTFPSMGFEFLPWAMYCSGFSFVAQGASVLPWAFVFFYIKDVFFLYNGHSSISQNHVKSFVNHSYPRDSSHLSLD